MGKVAVGLTMSLDGFIAGTNDGPDNPLGDGGERLFEWYFTGPPENRINDFFQPPDNSRVIIDEMLSNVGAIVTGRRTYDIAGGWGGNHPIGVPFFVLTHRPPETTPEEMNGAFVTNGIESALEQAQAVAGDRMVAVGAADVAQQYLRAGLLDEIHINLVPVLLGGGVRMFDHLDADLECARVIESTGVTHLSYRVLRKEA